MPIKLTLYVPDFRTWKQETLASIARDLLAENQRLRQEIEELKQEKKHD